MKRNIFTFIVVGLLLLAIVAMSATTLLYLRESEHNDFHRSVAAQNKLLAELRYVYPRGTPMSVVIDDFEVDEDDLRETEQGVYLRILPPLRGLDGPEREYRGFTFAFDNGSVVRLERVGPDGPGTPVPDEKFLERLHNIQDTSE